MGLDKLKKKKPNQLVFKRKDGKRPGYRGRTDADTMSGSGYGAGSSSSSNSGSGDEGVYEPPAQSYTPAPEPEYDTADFAFTTPSPKPTPATTFPEPGIDYIDLGSDRFTPVTIEDVRVYAKDNRLSTVRGGYEPNITRDTGNSLYVSPTQTIKDEEPYIDYKPGPNYVTADELSNVIRGTGDADERVATLAKIQAVNPIQQPTGILQKTGTKLKNMAIDYALNAFTGGLYGKLKTPYNIAQAIDNRLLGDRVPKITELAKFVPQGTGDRRPDTATGYQSDGDDRLVPKDVITASVQKFSPEQLNRAILIRDKLQTAAEQGVQLNKENQMTLRGLNQLIEKYQVDKPETMVT